MKEVEKKVTSISVKQSTIEKGKLLVKAGEFQSFSHAVDMLIEEYYNKINKRKK